MRPAILPSLALTGFSYLVFLSPVLLEPHRFPPIGYLGNIASVSPHLALFPALYAAVYASRSWRRLPRFTVIAVTVAACSVAHAFLDVELLSAFLAAVAPEVKPPVNISVNLIIYLWLYAFFAAIVGLIISNEAMRLRERQLAEARAAAQEAQLAALRFQLNPHFLFNTLNAISSLIIGRRNDEAERMMDKLSDFLRSTLQSDPNCVVTLAEELETTVIYLDIEQVRFGDRLSVEVDCPSGLASARAPSFLLQPVVENAIKHGVAPSRAPVTIRITAERGNDGRSLVLTVHDNAIQSRGVVTSGDGVGLVNVRTRLKALYGDHGTLTVRPEPDGFVCIVTLPLDFVVPAETAA